MEKYNYKNIEKKWQEIWEKEKPFQADEKSKKKKYYVLDMFAYISGAGLHVGHPKSYTATDIISRHKRACGLEVLHPVGWDAFGLPTENKAIKEKTHPKELTAKYVKRFRKQIKSLGFSYDWSRELTTCDPEYYKWTQWLFLQFYKAGLAYKKKAPVNWCESCKTVLANEQVVGGKCERCKNEVAQKELSQWFFKITKYIEPLLNDLEKLDWPESLKSLQKNWVGKSEGININYQIEGSKKKISAFTTRPDTNFGATFLVLAPESEFVAETLDDLPNKEKVKQYIKVASKKTELERKSGATKKTGVFTGLYAINDLNKKKMPIYIGDFVLTNVGTGAVVGVPGHDLRDFEFAQTMDLEIIRVVVGSDGDKSPITKVKQVQEEEGTMINSEFLNGMDIHKATQKVMDYIEEKGWGKRTVNYKLRDWLISRQRYWGAPIPIIYCDKCGEVPVPEKDLPVELPDDVNFLPTGESPLAKSKSFHNVKCPKCNGGAKRESDTMDTFVDSSWYFLRYTDPQNQNQAFDNEKIKKWLPVDIYIGGAEHAVLHLLYARFITKALKDLGYLEFNEPFTKLVNQGLILAEDGKKMSKSLGNVINPDDIISEYGADTLRVYEMFIGPIEDAAPWDTKGIIGIKRFLDRVWKIDQKITKSKESVVNIQPTINKVTSDIENLRFNTAISSMMEFVNSVYKNGILEENMKDFLIILSPFAPHLAAELWQKMKFDGGVWQQSWPQKQKIQTQAKSLVIIQVNGKVRSKITASTNSKEDAILSLAKKEKNIQKYIKNQQIKKVIYIPSKILNIVI
ncbi:leucine--tRNA ligase [Patescibacteria group bacterium]